MAFSDERKAQTNRVVQDARSDMASNTANITDECAFYGRVPKGSLPHWTVAGSRWIRDEKSNASDNPKTQRRGRRPEVIRTEIRDGREIKICESPDTYDLCEVKIGSYPNRPQQLEWQEPSPEELGWGDPHDNYGELLTREMLDDTYRSTHATGRSKRRSGKGRKVVHEASALKHEPTLSREQRRERFHCIREHEKARAIAKGVDTSTAANGSTQAVTAAKVGSLI